MSVAPATSLDTTVVRWLIWTNVFCFGYATVVEFTHFYCLTSLIGLFAIAAFMGTLFGVIVGLLAHSFRRDGVQLWPTSSLEQGGWRAFIAGVGLALLMHLGGH